MAGHLLFNSGSNESSLAPQFKWLDNTLKTVFYFLPSTCRHHFLTIFNHISRLLNHSHSQPYILTITLVKNV
jgi:hypothetical protein